MAVPRLGLMVTMTLGLLAAPLAAQEQQPAKLSRIGFLATGAPADTGVRLEAFRQGLRELGYVEGRSIAIEVRWAEGKVERLPDLAAELVRLKVDVILASSTPVALAAKNATRTIPIVFASAGDPVRAGLVASIARPGGNVTGLSLLAPELVARQLQLLKEAVPKASRVAVLSNPANPYTAVMVEETEAAARSLGVRVQFQGVRGADALDSAFTAIMRERPGAILTLFDPMLTAHRARIVELTNKNRLPAMYPHREYAETGGLMAYGASLPDLYRRAATYVDKILKGAKPADLPVEQPVTFELVINLKTAKALGFTIPQSLLSRADEVIK
jgi:putative ABC transport system substrate-binding protein